jgi:hypothetical protein
MTYRFYLTVGSSVTEVFPLNFLESTLNDEQEGENVFYRRKFNGNLTFINNNGDDDFDLLLSIDQNTPCAKLLFEIKRAGVNYWSGCFSTTDGKFDLDKCTFEVAPLPNDDYLDILDKAEDQYNILTVTPIITTRTVFGNIYTRNRLLWDVIEYLAGNVKSGATVSSDFFTAATNPATLSDNDLLHLTIAQKSDIIRPSSSEAATEAMMSWNELMEILWAMFQVKWDYDAATDTINVEHVSWWSYSAGLDLRTQLISKAGNKFSYLKEKMPKYEKFSFMESFSLGFAGHPIWYDSSCVDQNPNSNTKETTINVTTDLEYIINNPLEIADEGFVILCNYLAGATYFIRLSVKLNMPLSWTQLHNCYFRHNRVLIEGYMNNSLVTFWTAQKTKLQPTFAIVCPSDNFDPSDEVTTELGESWGVKGKVKDSSLNPNGEMKLSLIYGPPDNEQTPIENEKTILIVTEPNNYDENTNAFSAYLSIPSGADIDILIRETIYNSDDSVHCTGGWETWTIPSGSSVDNFVLNICAYMQDVIGGRIEFEFDTTDAVGWTVTY